MMQEIQAIQASTHLADTKENTTHKTGITTATDSGAERHSYQDDSTKVTLSDRAEHHKNAKETEAEKQRQEAKESDNQEIDYSLAMSGIPQYGGHLVTVIKYPNGRTEMIDAFSGKKITQQDIELEQLAKGNSQAQQSLGSQSTTQDAVINLPGESSLTDTE